MPHPLAQQLLAWYETAARPLPWRLRPDPYHTLLSELMCQQTRIDTVIPYFERFVTRWPTLRHLADADVDDVMTEWAGLGYYSRARNLHAAAKAAVAAGGLPPNAEALRELPGIGPYTAGAIASIAFSLPEPAIDGNVERVISRLDGLEADPKLPAARRAIDARVRELLVGVPPGELNQALMELGATVCSPRNPACNLCVWAEACVARASGDPERLPNKAKKPPPVPIRAVAGVLMRNGEVLLGKRPPGLLGGLWEPIGAALEELADPRATLKTAFRERAGVDVTVAESLGEVIHVFSHRKLTLSVYAVVLRHGEPALREHYDDVRFVDPAKPEVALSTLTRKTLALADRPALALFAADAQDSS